MYHVEMRMGMEVVREFNLSEQRLWSIFLAPLMAGQEFTVEGHKFVPRQTRLKVFEGAQLRPDQLGMGRGWQNVERSATDVTERVLTRAREHSAASAASAASASAPSAPSASVPSAPSATSAASLGAAPGAPTATVAADAAAADLLRERLIGRLSAGPIAATEVLSIATELMPASGEAQRLDAARRACWALLERDLAQLTPSGR